MPTVTQTILIADLSESYKLDAAPAKFGLWGANSLDPTRTIDPSQETFVVTHGFLNSGDPPEVWIKEMASSIRASHPNANIVISSWETTSGFSALGYPVAPLRVDATARELAGFLDSQNVNPNSLTLIGHSLGAQVSGLTGQYMSQKPKLIIGLDPAGPIYEGLPSNMRLSPDDAQRVVALHTSRTFGYDFPIADLDVFVNPNGLFQPGSTNAIDNHGYANTLMTELLNGANYGGLNWEALNDPTKQGVYSADTFGNNRMSPMADLAFLNIQSLWNWIERLQKYQNAQTGQVMSGEQEQQISDNLNRQSEKEIYQIGTRLQNKEISVWQWERETAEVLKKLHLQQAILARGGADRMTAEDYLAVGRILKEEYKYLHQLALDLRNGTMTPAMLRYRLSMYIKRSKRSREAMKLQNMRDLGFKYMERILAFHDRHCVECLDYAGKGKQPIGTLPLPTEDCTCRANCTCDVRYFKEA